MEEKLAELARRFDELTARMADPEVYAQPGAFQKIARDAAELEPVVKCWRQLESVLSELSDARELIELEEDGEMLELAQEEAATLSEQETTLRAELRILLLPKDPNDGKNAILEIRAGTGGDEAAPFFRRPLSNVWSVCRKERLENRASERITQRRGWV